MKMCFLMCLLGLKPTKSVNFRVGTLITPVARYQLHVARRMGA